MAARYGFLLILIGFFFAQGAHAEPKPIFLGEAADGTRIMFKTQLTNDYKKAIHDINVAAASHPRTAAEYAARMKNNCNQRFHSNGKLGMLGAYGAQMVDQGLQQTFGDSIGFAVSQVAASPQDDPAWFVHFAENAVTGDMLTQMGTVVGVQNGITQAAIGLMEDICQYYEIPNRHKQPIPTDHINENEANALKGLNAEEATITRKIYKYVRVRRALVNGGAMGVGMVLGQTLLEAKNDPNLRLCMRESFKKRWGEVSDFAAYADACKTAARTWFSKSKSADLAASVVSSLLSGGATYGVTEGVGAGLSATGMMDRYTLLKYLSSPEFRRLRALKSLAAEGGRAAWFTVRGIKFAASTTVVSFAIEVVIQAATSVVIYYVDQAVVRPIIIPWAKAEAFKFEVMSDSDAITSSLDRALTPGNQNWETKKILTNPGTIAPTFQTVDVPLAPVESLISTMMFKSSQWRDNIVQDANEIRANWMDAVRYPDQIMREGKLFYETMIDLGGHDSLYPVPLTWDFYSNPNSKFKAPLKEAVARLTKNNEDSKRSLDGVIYELDTAYHYIARLQTPPGRQELLDLKLVDEQFINRISTPEMQQALKRDGEKVKTAGLALLAAFKGSDVESNVKLALEALVKLVNDPDSVFAFPAFYRPGPAADAYAESLKSGFKDLGNNYSYNDWSDNCGQVTAKGDRKVKTVQRWPVPSAYNGTPKLRYRCNNEERYAFVKGVYQNRIYMALKNYVGFPFKLQPRVEDVEQILNVVSGGSLFQQNTLSALGPDHPYKSRSWTSFDSGTLFGHRIPSHESEDNVHLYSNLDLYVNGLLCGTPLNKNYVSETDLPILKVFKKDGLRMKVGIPSISVEVDGLSTPFVCSGKSGMAAVKYVDYYSKDLMFSERGNVAPMRTALTYVKPVVETPTIKPPELSQQEYSYKGVKLSPMWVTVNHSPTIPKRMFSDYLELATHRINPDFLRDPQLFENQWSEQIEKPYSAYAKDRGLQGRYEKLMKETMLVQGNIWRRKGDYSKCIYQKAGDFLKCSNNNTYAPQDLMNPWDALTAFNQHDLSGPQGQYLNGSIMNGLDQFVKTNYAGPLRETIDQSGRGLFVSTAAELTIYQKIIWKLAASVQARLSAAGVESNDQMTELKVMLRRLSRANEFTWQMIDENTPTNPQACTPERLQKGCTGSRIATFAIVKAVLPMVAYPSQRAFMKRMEIERNGRLLPKDKPKDNRLASNLSNQSDIGIDEAMKNFADSLKITPDNPYGTIEGEIPDLAFTYSRADSFFRTAKSFAMMSVELDLLRTARALSNMIWAKKADGKTYVISESDRAVLTSIVSESVRAMRSTFSSIHSQVALFDAFKRGDGGNPKIAQRFGQIEDLAYKLEDLASATLDFYTETTCERRLSLDHMYRSRPDLNRSVSCAVSAGKLTLEKDALKRFEDVVP